MPSTTASPSRWSSVTATPPRSCRARAAGGSGAALSESRLGLPDVGLMGVEETLAACRHLTACSNVALLADGDTGNGNAVNVFHLLRAFENPGPAGVMTEDQQWP